MHLKQGRQVCLIPRLAPSQFLPNDSPKVSNRRDLVWSRRDLNPRPPRCERGALPAELLPHSVGILRRIGDFQTGPQTINELRPFQAEADLRRDEPDPIAEIVALPGKLVPVHRALTS